MALDVSTVKVPSVSRLTPLIEPVIAYELESTTQMDELEAAYASISGNLNPFLPMYSAKRFGKETYRLQSGRTSTLKTDDSMV